MLGRINSLSFGEKAIVLAESLAQFKNINQAYDNSECQYSYADLPTDSKDPYFMSENKLGKYMARIYATNGFNIKGRFRTDANSLEKYKSGEKETLTLALGPRKFMPVLYAGKILEAIKYKSWNYSAMWDKKKLQGKIKH